MTEFLKKALRRLFVYYLKQRGYSDYGATAVFNSIYDDLTMEKRTTLAQKLWAYQRGFPSYRIQYYGLTGENYRNYLSDAAFSRLHPINGAYSHWIDDKLTVKYLLQPFSKYLPDYYFHIYQGEVLRLVDCPTGCEASVQGILDLLKEKGALAIKPAAGTLAIGFHKLGYLEGGYSYDGEPITIGEVTALLSKWLENEGEQYLFTEYMQAHSYLKNFWDGAPPTLRLVVKREKAHSPTIILSFIHFASQKSGVRNVPFGITCIVDVNTGVFSDGYLRTRDKTVSCKFHPDTNLLLEGKIPNWDLVCEKILEICGYLAPLRYLGFDTVVTEDGFKIIEINSHSGIDYFQRYQPLLTGEMTKDFFNGLLAEKGVK